MSQNIPQVLWVISSNKQTAFQIIFLHSDDAVPYEKLNEQLS